MRPIDKDIDLAFVGWVLRNMPQLDVNNKAHAILIDSLKMGFEAGYLAATLKSLAEVPQ